MRGRLLVLAGLCLPLLGCGGESVVAVSGRVNLDGKPLAGATVNFQPTGDGAASVGETGADGRYTLKTVVGGKSGAVVGAHRVSVSAFKGPPPDSKDDSAKARPNLLPERYNTRTELKFDVPAGGSDKADFDLVSAAKGGS